MRFGLFLLVVAAVVAFWYGQRWLQRHPQAWHAVLNGLWVSGLIIITGLLLARGHTAAVFLLLGVGLPLAQRAYSAWQQLRQAQHSGASEQSTHRTAFLQISVDHTTGMMQGYVLAGTAQGHRLDALSFAQLLALLREYQGIDADSARLLAAYLDQQHPHWRAPPTASGMSRTQAQAILGVTPQATADEIRAAHRRLIQRLHPDRGGSDYLAAQINQAKDVLLGG